MNKAIVAKGIDEAKVLAVEWLWPDRFPLGMLSLLCGEQGTGKTFLSLYMIAHVTTGRPWPDRPNEKTETGDVVMVIAEDSMEYTLKPRLRAMNASIGENGLPCKVFYFTHVTNPVTDKPEFFNLKNHLIYLDEFLKENKSVRLVVFDPLEAFMGEVDTHRNSSVRSVLDPLAEIIARHKVAVVGIHHLNKRETTVALHRIMGSTGYSAVARMVWLLAPDREDKGLLKMVRIKGNICPNVSGLGFRLQSATVQDDNGADMKTAIVAYERKVDDSADDLLSTEENATPRNQAGEWLEDMLLSGPRLATEILEQAEADGIAERTLKRAKKKLKVISRIEVSGKDKRWTWSLPD